MTLHRRLSLLTFLGFAAVLFAVDPSGDEAANRKLLAHWQLNDPDRMRRLEANLLAIRALPAEKQERLRQFDRTFQELDTATQSRLKGVMERYTGWLSRLPSDERARVNAAAPGPERLKVVDQILDRQWQESLPKPDRDRLAKLTSDERSELLKKLRNEEDDRRDLRRSARRAADEFAAAGRMPGLSPEEFRERVRAVVEESLRPLVTAAEEPQLTREGLNRITVGRYYGAVYDLSEKYRLPLAFPGPAPPGRTKAYLHWKDLPAEILSKLPHRGGKAPSPVAAAEGRWPEFPLAVVEWARAKRVELPANLFGPTKLEELPRSVLQFVRDDLYGKLTEDERQQLADAEGKWPDYPKKVKALADKHKLTVPGLSLPGGRENWRQLREFQPKRGPGVNG